MSEIKPNHGFDADFDTFWKEVLDFVEPATQFFLPDLYRDVDWSVEYKSLEQELRSLSVREKGQGRRTDKLFQLRLKDGSDRLILFHIEAEAYPNNTFPKRMFEYYVFLSIKHRFAPITMLALFVGDIPIKAFNRYTTVHYGTGIDLHFQTFCVGQQSEDALLESDNPLALALLANLYVIHSKGDMVKRFELKRKLITILLKRRIALQQFKNILNFALNFVRLPVSEENNINDRIFQDHINKTRTMTNRTKPKFIDYYAMMERLAYIEANGETPEETYLRIEIDAKRSGEAAAQREVAQEIQRKSEEMQRKSEEMQRKSEEMQRKAVLNLHKNYQLSPEQISTALEIDLLLVKHILTGK